MPTNLHSQRSNRSGSVTARGAKACIAVAVLMALVTMVPMAEALDAKRYSGTACTANSFGTTAAQYNSIGAIENWSTTSVTSVFCPGIHDDTGDDEWNDLEVLVYDANSTQNITCWESVSDGYGTTTSSSLSSSGTGDQVLDFGVAPANVYGSDATFWFFCNLPPNSAGGASGRSAVYGYYFDE